jgi:hypothetical protein
MRTQLRIRRVEFESLGASDVCRASCRASYTSERYISRRAGPHGLVDRGPADRETADGSDRPSRADWSAPQAMSSDEFLEHRVEARRSKAN